MIRETGRTELVGGSCESSDIGQELRGATAEPRTHEAPIVERLALADCSGAEKASSPASCRRFGDTPRWKLAADEPGAP